MLDSVKKVKVKVKKVFFIYMNNNLLIVIRLKTKTVRSIVSRILMPLTLFKSFLALIVFYLVITKLLNVLGCLESNLVFFCENRKQFLYSE